MKFNIQIYRENVYKYSSPELRCLNLSDYYACTCSTMKWYKELLFRNFILYFVCTNTLYDMSKIVFYSNCIVYSLICIACFLFVLCDIDFCMFSIGIVYIFICIGKHFLYFIQCNCHYILLSMRISICYIFFFKYKTTVLKVSWNEILLFFTDYDYQRGPKNQLVPIIWLN